MERTRYQRERERRERKRGEREREKERHVEGMMRMHMRSKQSVFLEFGPKASVMYKKCET